MRLTIHIGLAKTGTSAIQSNLFTARDRMREHGVIYPQAGLYRKERAHHDAAWAFGGHCAVAGHVPPTRRMLLEELRQEVSASGARHIVMSSEGFSRALLDNPNLVSDFAGALSGRNFDLVAAVRRASDYHESFYFQQLRSWASGRIGVRVLPLWLLRRKVLNAPAQHLAVIQRALQLTSATRIFLYTPDFSAPEVCAQLCELPTNVFVKPSKPTVNQQWNSRALALAYLLATHPKSSAFQSTFNQNRAHILEVFSDGGKTSIFSPDQRANIDAAADQRLIELVPDCLIPEPQTFDIQQVATFDSCWSFSYEQRRLAKELFNVSLGALALSERSKLIARRLRIF